MIDPKVIRNYALCLFKNITSNKNHKIVLEQISSFNDLVLSSDSLELALNSPIVSNSSKLKLIESLSKKFKFEKITKQFLEVVVKNSRPKILSLIIDEYKKLLEDNSGIKSVTIEAANSLTKKEIDIIKNYLENRLDKKVTIEVCENKSLIGGVVIKHDSLLYDYSINGAIERVEKIAAGVRL